MSRSERFSQARLGRMAAVMHGYVERGEVAGIVTLLSRRDEVLKFLQCVRSRKQRMVLTTMYATGLRVGEAARKILKISRFSIWPGISVRLLFIIKSLFQQSLQLWLVPLSHCPRRLWRCRPTPQARSLGHAPHSSVTLALAYVAITSPQTRCID